MDIFDHESGISTDVSPRLKVAIRNVEFARRYTLSLLQDLSEVDWYWTSPDANDSFTTHIAWQAGHIAMAQYGLMLFQQRGRDREIDSKLMSSKFRKLFMRGTKPSADRSQYPSPDEILETMERVQAQSLIEVPGFDGDQLDQPLGAPHAGFATRYGALLFAGGHELVHAGQIGILRRLMGKEPLR